ncbi:MAG: hypothetical protein ACFFEF_08245 [Candidatus Thorarchaeota archaeon]
MSIKNTNSKVLLEDLKVSFKFAFKNVISFFLGILGVLLVTLIVLLGIVLIIFPLLFLSGGLEVFMTMVLDWVINYQTMSGAAMFLMILVIITPILAPLMVAVGALYGMGREIVESDGTTAEGVFVWYSKKFMSLAGGGLIQFLIALAPIAAVAIIFGPISLGPSQFGLVAITVAVIAVYAGIMTGLTSMVFPAIIDGHSVLDAVKISFRMSRTYFDRVFSVWFSFLGIALLIALPMILPPLLQIPLMNAGTPLLALYAGIMGLFDVFILLPAMVIGMSRIYLILSSDNISGSEHTEEGPSGIGFVGGL